MKRFDWKTLVELVGIAAIVASLVFVGLQMRQAQDIAYSERAQTQATNTIEITNEINEHPEIWARGLAGEHLDEIDEIVFGNLMLAWNDMAFFSSTAALVLGNESAASFYVIDYGDFLYRNPGARQWFETRQTRIEEEIGRLSRGSVISTGWNDRIEAVWAEIERTQDHGSPIE